MIIWRIEFPDGLGAYQGGACDSGEHYYYASPYHPEPWRDIKNCPDNFDDYIFGFETIQQARTWFSSKHDLKDCYKKDGLRLARYISEDYFRGKFQVMFKKGTRLQTWPAHKLHTKRKEYFDALELTDNF